MDELVIDGLALFRGVRLISRDVIFDRPRAKFTEWVWNRAPEAEPGRARPVPKLIELAGCPWCLSVYGAVIVIVLRTRYPKLWSPVARGLALSALVGLIATNLDKES